MNPSDIFAQLNHDTAYVRAAFYWNSVEQKKLSQKPHFTST
jgi:hypothetical protein